MSSGRVWLIVLSAVVMLQASVRPAANILSMRDDSRSILSRISAGTDRSWRPPTGVASFRAADYQCGVSVDIERLEPIIGEVVTPLRWAAERIYQDDLLTAAAENLSPWEVRLWQVYYGVGLWSGRLDDGPVSNDKVQTAKAFAERYYRNRLRQFACDTARGMRPSSSAP